MEKKKANASEHEIELLEINREEIIQRNEDNILALTKSFESNEKTYQNYDTFDIKIKKNDIIVLCCDGLYN
jgi:serine/threonine protein phosphatase PrpC